MPEPGLYNLRVRRGETWSEVWTWTDDAGSLVNLTGYTAALDVRWIGDSRLLLRLTDGSGITLGGTAGTITVAFTAAQTLAFIPGDYRYDIRLTSGTGAVTYLLAGGVGVFDSVTVG